MSSTPSRANNNGTPPPAKTPGWTTALFSMFSTAKKAARVDLGTEATPTATSTNMNGVTPSRYRHIDLQPPSEREEAAFSPSPFARSNGPIDLLGESPPAARAASPPRVAAASISSSTSTTALVSHNAPAWSSNKSPWASSGVSTTALVPAASTNGTEAPRFSLGVSDQKKKTAVRSPFQRRPRLRMASTFRQRPAAGKQEMVEALKLNKSIFQPSSGFQERKEGFNISFAPGKRLLGSGQRRTRQVAQEGYTAMQEELERTETMTTVTFGETTTLQTPAKKRKVRFPASDTSDQAVDITQYASPPVQHLRQPTSNHQATPYQAPASSNSKSWTTESPTSAGRSTMSSPQSVSSLPPRDPPLINPIPEPYEDFGEPEELEPLGDPISNPMKPLFHVRFMLPPISSFVPTRPKRGVPISREEILRKALRSHKSNVSTFTTEEQDIESGANGSSEDKADDTPNSKKSRVEATWTCSYCQEENSMEQHARSCGKCQKERVWLGWSGTNISLSKQQDMWSCRSCAVLNSKDVSTCVACEVPRDESTKSTEDNGSSGTKVPAGSETIAASGSIGAGGFSFTGSSSSAQSSSVFSWGGDTKTAPVPAASGTTSGFSFGAPKSASPKEGTKGGSSSFGAGAFSFAPTPAPAPSADGFQFTTPATTNGGDEKKEAFSFSFGASAPAPALSNDKKPPAPSSSNATVPASTSTESVDPAPKSVPLFGAPTTQETQKSGGTNGGSIGGPVPTSSNLFKFGGSSPAARAPATSEAPTPQFSFPPTAAGGQPKFNFGTTSTSAADSSKPTLGSIPSSESKNDDDGRRKKRRSADDEDAVPPPPALTSSKSGLVVPPMQGPAAPAPAPVNLFGSSSAGGASKPEATPAFSFGSTPAPTASTSSPAPSFQFGQTSGDEASGAPAVSLPAFGGSTPAPAAPTFQFGSTAAPTPALAPAPPPMFCGAAAPEPAQAAFGSTPAATSAVPPSFGSTPAGFGSTPAPAPAAFGSGGFGSTSATSEGGFGSAPAPAPGGFGAVPGGFGATPAPAAPVGFGSTPAPTAPGGFGSTPTPGPGGFGSTPAQGPGGFGSAAAVAPGGFGSAPAAPFGSAPGGGFGNAPNAAPPAFGSTPAAPASFGSAPAAGGFGAPAPAAQFGGGGFGAAAPAPFAPAPAPGGGLGAGNGGGFVGATNSNFGANPAGAVGGNPQFSIGTGGPPANRAPGTRRRIRARRPRPA